MDFVYALTSAYIESVAEVELNLDAGVSEVGDLPI